MEKALSVLWNEGIQVLIAFELRSVSQESNINLLHINLLAFLILPKMGAEAIVLSSSGQIVDVVHDLLFTSCFSADSLRITLSLVR